MKKNIIICGLAALLAGCSLGDDSLDVSTSNVKIGSINLKVEPFVIHDESGTRTTLTHTATEFSFAWSDGDTLGLFPIAPVAGSQVYQILAEKENAETGALSHEFDGGAWQLRAGNSYVAYHPFNKNMKVGDTYTEIPVNMLGQKQVGKSSTTHIGKYDYMYAEEATVPASTVDGELPTVDFSFHHAVSIAIVNLTVPVAQKWNKITIKAEDKVFITKATMDARTGKATATETSSKYELDLVNISSTADEKLTFYLSILPTVISSPVTVTAEGEDGIVYNGTLKAKTFEMGQAYNWNATLQVADEYDGLDYVDLGLTIMWARKNVNISNSEDGEYYAWAELDAKSTFDWSNYTHGNSPATLTYCTPADGFTDLYPADDDVAYNKIEPNGYYRIPTKDEWEELVTNCDWSWTTIDGVTGYKVSHKKNARRYIFLPVTGLRQGSGTVDNLCGYYWSRDVNSVDAEYWSKAYCLKFNEYNINVATVERCYGAMIRPVYDK